MRLLGKIERRLVLAILITALIPLAGALLTSRAIIARVSATAFQPEFGDALDQSLGVYADLVKAIKQGMRYEADAIVASQRFVSAAASRDKAALQGAIDEAFPAHEALVSLRVESGEGDVLAQHARASQPNAETERTLEVRREIGGGEGDPLVVVATFATSSKRLTEIDSMQQIVQAYHQIESDQREAYLDSTYQSAFAVLLLFTIVVAIAAGSLIARPVSRRIARLAAATRPVAEGDLSVRVPETGDDEVADLALAFNRMLVELDESRARIEFLRRMNEWQKMARRLAHEIKNPLTPIQLAVEECHRRYAGDDPAYGRIVQTMYEVVTEEVGTLRRLVSEFSSFARLPRAELLRGDLGEFLREQRAQFELPTSAEASDEIGLADVSLAFDIEEGSMPADFDREMLHRVLTNIVQNAAQALRDSPRKAAAQKGRIAVRLGSNEKGYRLDIDDDGPGIDPEIGSALLDPYVTTKRDGTGLGLSIVKKIVMDHGGRIEASRSPLGGARFAIHLPRDGARVADSPPSSRRAAAMAAPASLR